MAETKTKRDFSGNIAAQAWENTKTETDPHWQETGEVGFWNDMQFAADKVRETGVVRTKFEQEVKDLLAKQKPDPDALAPNAVVGTPAPDDLTSKAASAGGSNATGASNINLPPGSGSGSAAQKDAVGTTAKTDQSGHVAKGAEAAAIVKDQSTAPLK